MRTMSGLLWSIFALLIAGIALARITGWRELEARFLKGTALVVFLLYCLPLLAHEAAALTEWIGATGAVVSLPRVVVVGARELALAALVALGHIVAALWLLRRKVRVEGEKLQGRERDADRRRERGRLPPRGEDGGAP